MNDFVKMSLFRIAGMLLRPMHGHRIRRYCASGVVRKLQIGSGPNHLPGWLNSDIHPLRADIFLDASRKMPFAASTFDRIFSEHLIEHLGYGEGRRFLEECWRILKPGGKIRLATPNLEFLIKLYGPQKTPLQERYVDWSLKRYQPGITGSSETFVINHFFHAWGHRFIYDRKVLGQALEQTGFKNTALCSVGESQDPELRGLERHGDRTEAEFNELETMIMEAEKPA